MDRRTKTWRFIVALLGVFAALQSVPAQTASPAETSETRLAQLFGSQHHRCARVSDPVGEEFGKGPDMFFP